MIRKPEIQEMTHRNTVTQRGIDFNFNRIGENIGKPLVIYLMFTSCLRPNALYAHPGLGNVARCWAQRMPMPIGCQFRFFPRSLLLHVISCDVMWQYQTFVQYLFLNLHDVCNMSWFWSHGSQGWCQCPDPRLLLKTPLGISAWPGTGK